MDSSSLAHCKWECQYHIVFIPKYRKKKLYGMVRDDVREIIRTLCKYKKVEIVAGAVCADHVHLCVSIPPKLSVSDFVGYLKGKSALMIFDKHPEMGNKSKNDLQHPPLGGYVCSPFRAIFKPPLEVVVLTLKSCEPI